MRDLVVGADIGGTSTRVGVATLEGEVLSLASGGPGNPNSVGMIGSATKIRSVTEQALDGVPGRVVGTVIGLAGGSRALADPHFLPMAVPARVESPAVLVSDLTVAFSSATPAPRGYVVLSGTGAVAGLVEGTELLQQRDGWGWLLGDEGSGFWIGRAAVRTTLAALQQARPLGPLALDVLASTGTTGYADLLQACYVAPPTWLAQFSLLVSRHADADPVAAGIVDKAAGRLLDLLTSLEPQPGQPVVLAGSVLAEDSPVNRAFRRRLPHHLELGDSQTSVLTATTGVVGALWLALRPWLDDLPSTHAKLLTSVVRRLEGRRTGY